MNLNQLKQHHSTKLMLYFKIIMVKIEFVVVVVGEVVTVVEEEIITLFMGIIIQISRKSQTRTIEENFHKIKALKVVRINALDVV